MSDKEFIKRLREYYSFEVYNISDTELLQLTNGSLGALSIRLNMFWETVLDEILNCCKNIFD